MRITVTVPEEVELENMQAAGCAEEPYALEAHAITYVQTKLAREFGGFTSYKAQGGWIDGEGKLVHDSVHVVETYTDMPMDYVKNMVYEIALEVKMSLFQDAAMYTIDNEAYFI